jgi:excisionase family DNA binding protein
VPNALTDPISGRFNVAPFDGGAFDDRVVSDGMAASGGVDVSDDTDAFDGALVLSINRTARALGCSRAQVYIWLNEGKLSSVKLGRRRLIEVREIRRFIASNRVER